MTGTPDKPRALDTLRARAVAHLTGPSAQPRVRAAASAALGVLYEHASSPSTGPTAMALLQELQVHQVEVELQDEELRRSRIELETSLNRHVQLYDHAPVAYFTVDRNTVLSELNLCGASLLGFERDVLRNRMLDGFLTPDSARTLRRMLQRVTLRRPEAADLQLRGEEGTIRHVRACACRDPAGEHFLIALMEIAAPQPASAA